MTKPLFVDSNSLSIHPNKEGNSMRTIVVVGGADWNDRRTTNVALQRVMAVYRDPYTLVCDTGTGAGRFAAAVARELGWTVKAEEVDTTKCVDDCPTADHRRPGGPAGDWCPSARKRALIAGLDNADLCIVLANDPRTRLGQSEARNRGIAVWTYTPRGGAR